MESFYKYNGFLNSPSEMNRLCRYIESIDFNIKQKISDQSNFNYTILQNYDNFTFVPHVYNTVCNILKRFTNARCMEITDNYYNFTAMDDYRPKDLKSDKILLGVELREACSDTNALTNYMVKYFYEYKTSYSKSVLWDICGKTIYKNILRNHTTANVPVQCEDGDIEFMYKKYKNMEVDIDGENI